MDALVQAYIGHHIARGHDDSWMSSPVVDSLEDIYRLGTGDVVTVRRMGYNPAARAVQHSVYVFDGMSGVVIGRGVTNSASRSYTNSKAIALAAAHTERMEAGK